MYAEQELPMHVTACTIVSKETPKLGAEARSAGQRSDLCPDQQQCVVAQGIEGKEGGEVPTGHLLAH